MTASHRRIGANASITVVATCTTTSSIAPDDETSRAGRPSRSSHAGAAGPRTIAAVLATFASTQDAAATLAVRHGVTAERPVRGSMTWWRTARPARQRRTVVPELA